MQSHPLWVRGLKRQGGAGQKGCDEGHILYRCVN